MSNLPDGALISFRQLLAEPAGTQVVYEGRIPIPAGAHLIDVYWYTRSDWATTVNIEVNSELVILNNGSPDPQFAFFSASNVGNVDTAESITQTGQSGASEVLFIADTSQDIIVTLTEDIDPGLSRIGVTFVGALWTVPNVQIVPGPPVIVP